MLESKQQTRISSLKFSPLITVGLVKIIRPLRGLSKNLEKNKHHKLFRQLHSFEQKNVEKWEKLLMRNRKVLFIMFAYFTSVDKK